MKKSLKMIGIIVAMISLVILLQNVSLGASQPKDMLNKFGQEENWKDADTNKSVANTTQRIVGTIINVIRIVGTGIAIIMITYVAIKYMSAAPTEKAEFKKSATAMIVGAIVLFATTNILSVIANFASSNI